MLASSIPEIQGSNKWVENIWKIENSMASGILMVELKHWNVRTCVNSSNFCREVCCRVLNQFWILGTSSTTYLPFLIRVLSEMTYPSPTCWDDGLDLESKFLIQSHFGLELHQVTLDYNPNYLSICRALALMWTHNIRTNTITFRHCHNC